MKRSILIAALIIFSMSLSADIAPYPIVVKGIYPSKNCKIRMVSEIVRADIYQDSSKVECTFEMLNMGNEISIDIGFPEMCFAYFSHNGYTKEDKKRFEIYVNNKRLDETNIKVPKEMEIIYEYYMKSIEADKKVSNVIDSICVANNIKKHPSNFLLPIEFYTNPQLNAIADSLYEWRSTQYDIQNDKAFRNIYQIYVSQGVYPWYVWEEKFKKGERKFIKVVYRMPCGVSYKASHRYFKYLLNTGAKWYGNIGRADVILQLHDIDVKNIEKISPRGYKFDKNQMTICWQLKNLNPTTKDDIYIQYFDSNERERYKEHIKAFKQRNKSSN